MIYGVYVIYDLSTEKYSLPFYSATDDSAIRSFTISMIGVPDLIIRDSSLKKIGSYDDVSLRSFPLDKDDSNKIAETIYDGGDVVEFFADNHINSDLFDNIPDIWKNGDKEKK